MTRQKGIRQALEAGETVFGAADLSVSLGHPLAFDHPDVRDAIETFVTAGRETGVPIGTGAGGYAGGIEAALDTGYRLLMLGSEVSAAREVLGEALRTARAVHPSRTDHPARPAVTRWTTTKDGVR